MKILFVHKRMLFPRDTGGKIRALDLLKHLCRRHEITYVCNLQPGEEAFAPQMQALGLQLEAAPARTTRRGSLRFYASLAVNQFSGTPFSVARNCDRGIMQRVSRVLHDRRFDLIICDSALMTPHVAGFSGIPKLLLQHNAEVEILERQSQCLTGWLRRRVMARQAEKMRRFESACGAEFDLIVAVSQRDRDFFEREYGWRHARAIDTAVDLDHFPPASAADEIAGRVLFVGSLDWLPNQDGVRWFTERCWPRVRRAHPSAEFHVVGRNPPRSLASLDAVAGVRLIGSVPDVRPHLAAAAVAVVPLRVGGGTRLKIFEAMAMERAVVSTTLGAEGLPIHDGEHLTVADNPEEFADAVIRLLDRPRERRRLAANANALVRSRFGAEAVAWQFETLCEAAVRRYAARRSALPSSALSIV